jgi:hypothetical protein
VSIRYRCDCGANIRLPHTAAGRKAKCKACGSIFTVPREPMRDEPSVPAAKPRAAVPRVTATSAAAAPAAPGAWLDEMPKPQPEPEILDLAADDPPPTRSEHVPKPLAEHEEYVASALDAGPWILGPERSFWADLVESFMLFLNPTNLIAFVVLVMVNLLVDLIPTLGPLMLTPRYGIAVIMIKIAAYGYIYAFYLAVVRSTAGGEDEFPNLWIGDYWEDLAEPFFQFMGTKLFVMWPAIFLTLYAWRQGGNSWWQFSQIDWGVFDLSAMLHRTGMLQVAAAAAFFGNLFWPAVLLAVAIGGTFQGLWPHVIVRTVIAAPVGYVAICAAIMLANIVSALPNDPKVLAALGAGPGLTPLTLRIVGTALGIYSSLVAMRVIGLYYRHYKRQLPWVAE